MNYVGLQSQIWRNNTNSVLLLIMFPLVLYALVWAFLFFVGGGENYTQVNNANQGFVSLFPWITVGVAVWFLIAWASHASSRALASSAS